MKATAPSREPRSTLGIIDRRNAFDPSSKHGVEFLQGVSGKESSFRLRRRTDRMVRMTSSERLLWHSTQITCPQLFMNKSDDFIPIGLSSLANSLLSHFLQKSVIMTPLPIHPSVSVEPIQRIGTFRSSTTTYKHSGLPRQ